MRFVLAFTLMVSLSGAGSVFAAGVDTPGNPAKVSGEATNSAGAPLANTTVRLRNADSGVISTSTASNGTGQFAFSVSDPGNYVIEVVDASGKVIGSSSVLSVTAGASITGVAVRLPAAAAGTLASKPFFATSAGLVTAAATAAGLVGVTVAATRNSGSPSK